MLQLHLPRHQQYKQFQKCRRLVPHHLLYRLAAAATEGKMHLADGVGVQRMTRTMDVAGKVSKDEFSIFARPPPPPGAPPPPPPRPAPPPPPPPAPHPRGWRRRLTPALAAALCRSRCTPSRQLCKKDALEL